MKLASENGMSDVYQLNKFLEVIVGSRNEIGFQEWNVECIAID